MLFFFSYFGVIQMFSVLWGIQVGQEWDRGCGAEGKVYVLPRNLLTGPKLCYEWYQHFLPVWRVCNFLWDYFLRGWRRRELLLIIFCFQDVNSTQLIVWIIRAFSWAIVKYFLKKTFFPFKTCSVSLIKKKY